MTDDYLNIRLKQELAFIAAMNSRVWYAAANAAHRLMTLGASPEDLTSLLGEIEHSMGGAAAAYQLATKTTANPHLITNADPAKVPQHFTKALGLPLEEGIADEMKVSQRWL